MPEIEQKVLILPEMITVAELAEKLDIPVTKLIGELFKNGIAATLNQQIDFDTVAIIIDELKLHVNLEKKETHFIEHKKRELSDNAKVRPPIVAMMGHVDHGKTSLLDQILGIKKAEDESGGITQHISAYQVERKGKKITFLDTPGHETFAAIRQHGAVLTDIVIVVVAADDGVKPQTVESVKFAKTAGAKIVVAINKIDKPTANLNLVMSQLATDLGLNPEEWGGDTIMVPVSAKTGEGVDKLLDMVLLVAEMENLRAENDIPAEGLIIESKMETGRGSVVRVLIENGELRQGDYIYADSVYGRVRTIEDWQGKNLKLAGPATPAVITGFKETPVFGGQLFVAKNEREARLQASKNYDEKVRSTANANITSSDMLRMMNKVDEQEEVTVIVKADTQGSLISVLDSLKLLGTNEAVVKIVASGVGDVTEGDIRLAESSKAIIYGFNVGTSSGQVKQLAMRRNLAVRSFDIIYELIDDVKKEMSAKLAPEIIETEIGELKVEGVFKTAKHEIICGGLMTKGKLYENLFARVFRGKEFLGEVTVTGVQKAHVKAKEVFESDMCGLSIETNKKISLEIGDKLEFFSRETKAREIA